ncbi:Translation initiation factor IF-2 [Mesoplasma sp. JKS002658]|uniref:translation initiation factor IF-2 n=1 Tax=Mesoplasma whartonense TaxID=2878854 RepID=UPI002022A003|nr:MULTISPECIES: translation initiation factor IF-2 [unclassified Mesoplasma]MCL8211239.1 Translation initiation factor IF-2 [Mesoplasma sp. JKS002664]MCL8211900.1 Translation initiation factor IF-2 [Mesoplasma sp. JKS002662]MCL8213116.1 Translation initiation factor IF-2 [Mesoplasma sp. JKS002660]MCL8213995.1 Translation initiation factor IF-2 [Mesoplasma sp. JKS002658]MCL8214577.1 Translation initiation factor IF-2 [Mesoplasma sp. JKS002663]
MAENKKNKPNHNKNQSKKALERQRVNQHTKTIKNKLKEEKQTGLVDGVFVYTGPLTIAEFALKINKPVTEIVKYFFKQGLMLNQNTLLSEDQIAELAIENGYDFKKENIVTKENLLETFQVEDDPKSLVTIPPVVTVMGHVDHGKTTLLDALRHSNITTSEAGGITQAIGAYQIVMPQTEQKITFIDTPGHEAFTEMRSRGANATNIIVLVVAADDGVMPQTEEAIDHARQAKVPMIVFINKMDKPGVNPDRVKAELMEKGVISEEWGGEVPFIEGSAKAKLNLDQLLENILLVAEVEDLKANPNKFASGVVLEAHLDKARGPVASVLVQQGTLRLRDVLVAGGTYGTIKDLRDDQNKSVSQAEPSMPVLVIGLNDVPLPGDKFLVLNDEKTARQIATAQADRQAREAEQTSKIVTLDKIKTQIEEEGLKNLNIIIKADTQGSVEALKQVLNKLEIPGVKIEVIRASVGAITSTDVSLAQTANAILYGFNVRPSAEVRRVVEERGVDLRLHNVIYKVVEELEQAAKGLLDPEMVEKVQGQAEVRVLFKHSAVGTIAGCYVVDGVIKRKDKVRVLRNGVVIYDGEIAGLKHEKDDIKEAKTSSECGITIKNFNDLKIGDIIESYLVETVANN